MIVKNAYQTKRTPQPQQTLSLNPTPSIPKPHTLKLFGSILYKLTPRAQIQKYTCLLKFNFRWGLFYTKFSKKITPHPTPESGPQIKNPLAAP